MKRFQKADAFDPNAAATNIDNIFGLPYSCDDADIVIIPVPWEVTASGFGGTAKGPEAVLKASLQVDLFGADHKDSWKTKIAMESIPADLIKKGVESRAIADQIINHPRSSEILDEVNEACETLNNDIYNRSLSYLHQNKLVATLGGDHSTCLGLIQALAEKYPVFSILQIDAHADLRVSFQGFIHSHASIMHNVLRIPQVSKLVQVGVRDLCDAEADVINQDDRISTYFDRDNKERIFKGDNWENICVDIVHGLSDHVYISFDIDGLNPSLCPGTGTPVPGGLEYEEAMYLLKTVHTSGKNIIGFDISETGNGKLDGNVSARILYRLANMTATKLKKPRTRRMADNGAPVKPH